MRHRVANRKLGRVTEHRISMLRNQAQALLRYGHIETTVPKAKELRPFVERLITIAKRGIADGTANKMLVARREVIKDIVDRDVVKTLFTDIAPRFASRPGGYTRILRLGARQGDAAEAALIELLGSEYDPKAKAEKEEKAEKTAKQKGVGGRLKAAADRLRGKRTSESAEGQTAASETKSQARAATRKGTGNRRGPSGS
jgi:large subunit ribosomal protein L17